MLLWFGHGCAGNRVPSKHEGYNGLGMDALVGDSIELSGDAENHERTDKPQKQAQIARRLARVPPTNKG